MSVKWHQRLSCKESFLALTQETCPLWSRLFVFCWISCLLYYFRGGKYLIPWNGIGEPIELRLSVWFALLERFHIVYVLSFYPVLFICLRLFVSGTSEMQYLSQILGIMSILPELIQQFCPTCIPCLPGTGGSWPSCSVHLKAILPCCFHSSVWQTAVCWSPGISMSKASPANTSVVYCYPMNQRGWQLLYGVQWAKHARPLVDGKLTFSTKPVNDSPCEWLTISLYLYWYFSLW